MKIFRPTNKAGFTLVEIMIVVLIIGILLAIAIPNFVAARESSRAKACIGNLKQIDSATQQYCMDKKYSAGTYVQPTINTVAATGLVGANAYIRSTPVCPSGGHYATATAINLDPLCDISTVNSDANYTGADSTTASADGKYYHGLG